MNRRPVVVGLVLSSALLLMLAAAPGAVAQTGEDDKGHSDEPAEETFVTLDDVGEGQCFPAVTLPGRSVECRFPLEGEGRIINRFDMPVVADQALSFDDVEPAQCRVDDDELVCEGVEAFYSFGYSRVSVRFGFGPARELGGFEVRDPFDFAVDGYVVGGREPVVMPGRPVVMNIYPNFDDHDITAWVMVSRRSSDEIISAFRVETSPPGQVWPETIVIPPEEPGRYSLTLCVGESADGCDLLPGHFGVQVIDPSLRELVLDHNRADSQRINIVFVGSGFESVDEMSRVAAGLLTFDGPVALDFEGRPLGQQLDEVDPDDVFDLAWGAFAIEPLSSRRDRFNFWYLEGDVVDDHALFHNSDPEFSRDDELAGFDLGHTTIVTLDLQTGGQFGRSEANWTSFKLREDLPDLEEMSLAGIYLAVDDERPYGAAPTLAHELGHAVFDLRDEYVEASRGVQFGYPNCANSIDQADGWWGDRIGEVDPFVHTYVALQERFGLHVPVDIVESVTTGFYPGGCYGVFDDAVRPTRDSMMNSELPVFGTVSRQRLEELLDQFSGRATLTSYDDLALRCLPATLTVPGRTLRCSGSLAPGVDGPVDGVRVGVHDRVGECVVGEIDADGARDVTCEEIELSGSRDWTVRVTIDADRAVFVTHIDNSSAVAGTHATAVIGLDNATDAATETTTTVVEPDFTVTGEGVGSIPWALGAGLFALVFVGVGGYLWNRGSASKKSSQD